MGRNQSRAASSLMRIKDETVAMAVDVAQTVALAEHDRATAAATEARQLSWLLAGQPQSAAVAWDTVEVLE
jgi:hypothetical protein